MAIQKNDVILLSFTNTYFYFLWVRLGLLRLWARGHGPYVNPGLSSSVNLKWALECILGYLSFSSLGEGTSHCSVCKRVYKLYHMIFYIIFSQSLAISWFTGSDNLLPKFHLANFLPYSGSTNILQYLKSCSGCLIYLILKKCH